MAILNEKCLEHIFAFLTPVEWVQVSQVCQLWKRAAEQQWRKITKIEETDRGKRNTPVIAANVAGKIVLCAAPFVKVLEMFDYNRYCFGEYVYDIENFSREKMLKLLQKKSTEIIELHYWDEVYNVKELIFLARIFQKNKIKTFTACLVGSAVRMEWFQIFLTESVEYLHLNIKGISTGTLEDCFPNLERLTIGIEKYAEDTLLAILPYVTRITSLTLIINTCSKTITLSRKLLWNITKMTELEDLMIDFCEAEVKCLDHFVNELAISCPKLQIVGLKKTDSGHSKWRITTSALRSVMLFPNLEELYLSTVEGFGSIFLPQMENLTTFCIEFLKESTINMESLCCAVKQMPRLQNLMIKGLMSKEQTLQVVCEMVAFAASRGKNVLLFRHWPSVFEASNVDCLKISRKNVREVEDLSNEQDQTLNMLISSQDNETYLDNVKELVETSNIKHNETFFINVKDYSSPHVYKFFLVFYPNVKG